jgi:hypothetical protein
MQETNDLVRRAEELLAQVEALQRLTRQLADDLEREGQRLRAQLAGGRPSSADTVADLDVGQRVHRVEQFLMAAGQARDRRAEPRRHGNLTPVLLADVGRDTEPVEAWVLDRSPGGLGLLVDEPIPVGATFHVRPSRGSSRSRWIPLRVRNCRPYQGGWNVGCQFMDRIPWNELRSFG